MKLSDIAQVSPQQERGPRRLTLDLMFASDADYRRASCSRRPWIARIGALYRPVADAVEVIPTRWDARSRSFLARPIMAGDPGDRDVYGAQQHHLCWE